MEEHWILRSWLESSQFGGSVRRLAGFLGVPLKTVEDWVYGRRGPGSVNRMKLYVATGLSCYQPRDQKENELLERLRLEQTRLTEDRVQRVLGLLQEVRGELEFFKNSTAAEREALRRHLDGRYVAYISNMLQMMVNEERFQTWLEMSRVDISLTLGRRP